MPRRRPHRRLLVASSDSVCLEDVGASLVDQGYDVRLARSVAASRLGLARQWFDLLLLDLDAQGESALGLLRELRQQFDDATLPIVVLVPPAMAAQAAQALKAGANRTLPKPTTPAVLAACIEVVLGEAAVQRSTRRERELVERLEAVDQALAIHPERRAPNTPYASVPSDAYPRLQRDTLPPYQTDDFASTRETPGPTTLQPFAAGLGDTTQQLSLDYTLFQALELGLSQSLEAGRPLSVLMLEAIAPASADHAEFGARFTVLVAQSVPLNSSAQQLRAGMWCVVLPETDEATAMTTAEHLLAVIRLRTAGTNGPPPDRINVGVATLAPDFEGSPFRLVDQAHGALERARSEKRVSWSVQCAEVPVNS